MPSRQKVSLSKRLCDQRHRGPLTRAPRAAKPPLRHVLPHHVEATPDGSTLDPWQGTITLGNEIKKLANNIALGRDAAGLHYRSNSIHGLFVREQQALGLLRDYSRTYNEHFDGFVVRKFNGTG